MARFRGTLSVPGNVITDVNNRMISPVQGEVGTNILGTLEYTFENSFRAEIDVFVQPGQTADLCAHLYNQTGELVQAINDIAGDVDQDYTFESENDVYVLCVKRGAKTAVTEADKIAYIREGGVRCLFCEAEDVHGGSIEIDAGVATQEISCCVCDATWTDQYTLNSVTDLEAPAQTPDR
jgi:hypothetical protein